MPAREVGHDAVHEWAAGEVVQAADDRKPQGAGWQTNGTIATATLPE
jgi:hypothetical protein